LARFDARVEIGTRSSLRTIGAVPELLAIDEEIGHPYMTNPIRYNSQAWSRRLELPWVIEQASISSGQTVLDVGSGDSALPIFFSRHGARVVTVDPDVPEHLPRFVATVRAALPQLPFQDSSFDVVCCVSVLEHLKSSFSENLTELFRVARHRIILTFDVALGPHALYGLSRAEVIALARALGKQLSWPPDPLIPSGDEARSAGPQVGVCLVQADRSELGWPDVRLSRTQMLRAALHRLVQRGLWYQLRVRRKLRSPSDVARRGREQKNPESR
jgi:SAM-dependent methyltransferase